MNNRIIKIEYQLPIKGKSIIISCKGDLSSILKYLLYDPIPKYRRSAKKSRNQGNALCR